MRSLALPFLLVALVVAVAVGSRARADEYNAGGTVAQGTGIQTVSGLNAGSKYAIQCPNIDGGSGQKVYYRPGGCSGCVTDAGQGDVLLDFATNPDPYPVTLRAGMSKVHLRGLAAADTIFCAVVPRSP